MVVFQRALKREMLHLGKIVTVERRAFHSSDALEGLAEQRGIA
jgi:hypothetical protein